MITWIQRYFQHHFRAIFAVLLGLIIVSFVFITNTSGGLGGPDRRVVDRPFFGYNLSLQSDQQKLGREAEISFSLNPRYEYGDLQNYALSRAALLHLADQWKIPATTEAETVDAIKKLPMFIGQNGQFDGAAYQRFLDNVKTAPRGGLSEGDIARVIRDDVRAEKARALLSGPGYVLPAEIKNQLAMADTSWTLATATADYAAFKPEIKPTEAELTQYFEQSGSRYDIPPRVVVSYVDFPATNFLDSVQLTEADVRGFYDANPARFPNPASSVPASLAVTPVSDPAANYVAVRPQVEAALRLERAQKLAQKAASDLRLAVFNAKVAKPEDVEPFLASRKLSAKTLPPFTREAVPAELGGSPAIGQEAFRLNADRIASDPLQTPNGAVVLFWKESLPAQKPLFAEVREKVASDYLETERRKRFVELGKNVKSQIETRLKAGEAFDKAAAAAGSAAGLPLETKTLPAFTLRTRPQDLDYNVLGTLERLDKGEVSEMVLTPEKGIFVYAIDKQAPEASETNPQFAETRNQIASHNSRFAANALVSELVENELKRSEPKLP